MYVRHDGRVVSVAVFVCFALLGSGWAGDGVVRTHPKPVAGEYLVILKTTDRTAVVAEAVAASYGGHVERVWQPINGFLINISDARDAARMSADPRVQIVEQDSALSFASGTQQTHRDPACNLPGVDCQVPISYPVSQTLDNRLWHLDRIDQDSPVLDGTYTYCAAGNPVYVYVVDTGVMRAHSEFGATDTERRARVMDGYDASTEGLPFGSSEIPSCTTPGACKPITAGDRTNFFATAPCGGFPSRELRDGDSGGYQLALYDSGHGTSVASLIAGQHVGVAKNATIIPVKVRRCKQSEIWIPHRAYRTGTILRANGADTQLWRVDQPGVSGATFPPGQATDLSRPDGTVRLVQMRPFNSSDVTGDDAPGPYTSAIVDGICWIIQDTTHRPAVVNFSAFFDGTSECIDKAIKSLTITSCEPAGAAQCVTVVASANNGNKDASLTMPGSLSNIYPVITVGGSMLLNNPDGDLEAGFNSTNATSSNPGSIPRPNIKPRDALWVIGPGDTSNLAPGNTVASNFGDRVRLFAPARNITSALISGPFDYRDNRGGVNASGTSFSAPITAGVAARLLSWPGGPTTPSDVRQALENTAIPDILADEPGTRKGSLRGSANRLLRASDVMFLNQPHQPGGFDVAGEPSTVAPIAPGTPTTLTVDVYAASPNVTYTWYKGADREHPDSQPVIGQGKTVTINPDRTSYYFTVVTADSCSVAPNTAVSNTSRVARVAVSAHSFASNSRKPLFTDGLTPPRLVHAPVTVSLDAPAVNGTPIRYDWYEGDFGRTETLLSTNTSTHGSSIPVTPMQPTKYWVRVVFDDVTHDYLDSDPLPVEVAVANSILPDSVLPKAVGFDGIAPVALTLQGDPYDNEPLVWKLDAGTTNERNFLCAGPTCRADVASVAIGPHTLTVASGANILVDKKSIVACQSAFTPALAATPNGKGLVPTVSGGILDSSYTLQWFEGPDPSSLGSSGYATPNGQTDPLYRPQSIGRSISEPATASAGMTFTPEPSFHDRAFWFRLWKGTDPCFSDSPEIVVYGNHVGTSLPLEGFAPYHFDPTSREYTLAVDGADPLSNFQWYRGNTHDTTYPVGDHEIQPGTSDTDILADPKHQHRWWLNLSTTTLPDVPINAAVPLRFWVRVYTSDMAPGVYVDSASVGIVNACNVRHHAVNHRSDPPPPPPPGGGGALSVDLSITLDADEIGATVEWFARDSVSSHSIGTGLQIHVTAQETTSYWAVISLTCGLETLTDKTSELTLTPEGDIQSHHADLSRVISVGGIPKTYALVSSQGAASDLSIPAALSTPATYAWRKGDQYDTRSQQAPVLGTATVLRVTGTGSYWVRTIDSSGEATDSAVTRIVYEPPASYQPPPPLPLSVAVEVFPGPGTMIGTQATLALTAVPYPPPPVGTTYQYQWREAKENPNDHTLSEDATFPVLGSDFVFSKGGIASPVAYWVRVVTPDGIVDSEPVLIVVSCDVAPYLNILSSPVSRHVPSGTTVTLFAVGGGRNLIYQWYRGLQGDVSDHIGSGGGSVIVPSAEGPYWVHATDDCGRTADAATDVYVCTPTIAPGGNPQDAYLTPSIHSVQLSVTGTPAKSGDVLQYQWYDGNINLPKPGETNPTLTVTQPGAYFAIVSSVCADLAHTDVQSATANVGACTFPILGLSPASHDTRLGTTEVLHVNTSGDAPTYQWYQGVSPDITNPIAEGGTTSTVSVQPNVDSDYWVRVFDHGACWTNSSTIHLTVCAAPVITTEPASSTVISGQTVTLTVAAEPRTAAPLHYTWFEVAANGTQEAVSGNNSPSFTTPALTTPRTWFVRIYSGAQLLTYTDSQPATIQICLMPSVVWSTATTQVGVGTNVTLQIQAPPAGSQTYWYRGVSGDVDHSTLMSGPLDVSYTGVIPAAPSTSYWVRVRKDSCYSDSGTLTINVCIPAITQQPAGAAINAGGSVALSVVANTSPLTYQWYKGASGDISQPVTGTGTGATTATYTASPAADTSYWVRVTGSCGVSTDSNAVLVSVCSPPAIVSTSPVSQWAILGSGNSTTVSVNATGSNLTYQWYFGNAGNTASPIVATTSSLSVTPQSTTSYWVRVSGGCGAPQNSVAMVVNVCGATFITAHPQGSTITSGGTATMSVTASQGTSAPMTYQWYRGVSGDVSALVANATSTSFTTPPLSATTSYWVRVSCGICNPADSQTATVTVCNNAQALASPGDQFIGIGQTATLSTVPTAGNVYQWYIGASGNTSQPAPGVSNQVSYAATPSVTTQYWVQIQNGPCTFRTASATVNVCIPAITQPPASIMINPGASTTLSVTANTPGLTYQWYVGNSGTTTSPIAGATGSTVTVSPSTATNYWVRVTGSCTQGVNSVTATVTICAPPVINGFSPTQSIIRNNSTSCFVTAAGTNLTYQWYVGTSGTTTTPISGGTGPSVSVTPQNTTNYWVRVTGTCGTALNSATMLVNVCAVPTITAQPQSSIIFSGATATMSVTASEATTTPVTYQWYRGASGDVSVPVGTNSTFTTPALTAQTNYWVRISCGVCNPADSQTATVSICYYPQSLPSPGDFYNTVGQTVRLYTSNVTGNTFQWYTGATGDTSHPYSSPYSPNMYYADVAPGVTTQYWVQVQNGGCISRTAAANVYVCVPTFTQQPAGTTIQPGSSTTLTASANTAGVTYQWYVGASGNTASPISGATGPSVIVTPGADTTYWVRAIGSCARTTDSAAATVVLCSPPVITQQAMGSFVQGGGAIGSMWVSATGSNLTYQWYVGNSGDMSLPIDGATASTFSMWLSATQKVWVRVTNMCGAVNSNSTFVSVYPTITQQPPSSLVVGYDTTGTISFTASGTYMSYIWKNSMTGAVIATTTTPTLITPSITTNTYIQCQVVSGNASVNAYETAITVCYNQPNISITKGANGACSVAYVNYGSGYADDYQWYQGARGDTSHLVGSGSTALYVCPTVATQYWLRSVIMSSPGVVSCYTDSNAVTMP